MLRPIITFFLKKCFSLAFFHVVVVVVVGVGGGGDGCGGGLSVVIIGQLF